MLLYFASIGEHIFAVKADTKGLYRPKTPRHNWAKAGPTTSTWQGRHERKVSGSCKSDQEQTDNDGAQISFTVKMHVQWAKALIIQLEVAQVE